MLLRYSRSPSACGKKSHVQGFQSSPDSSSFRSGTYTTAEPGVCPGASMISPVNPPKSITPGFITFGSGISPARNVFSSTVRFFPIACVSTRRRILSSVNMRQSAISASSMYVSGKQRAPIAWSWRLCVRNTVSGKSVMWRMKSATSSMP